MPTPASWLLLVRDVSDSIRIQGERALHACLVLDLERDYMLAAEIAPARDQAIRQALRAAATAPAGPGPHADPGRILCSPDLLSVVRAERAGLRQVEVVGTPPAMTAEDAFDSFLGHLAGRRQPHDFASPEDWELLYQMGARFLEQKPWQRWSDDVDLHLELTAGTQRTMYSAVVLGNAGIQTGLCLYPGPEPPEGMRDWEEGDQLPMPEGSLLFHLDARLDAPELFAGKAARYGWPTAAAVPVILAIHAGGPADVGRTETLHLAAALTAVLALDDRGLTANPEEAVSGNLQLPDGNRIAYEIRQRPPEQPEQGTLQMAVHQVGFDLVQEGAAVSLGSMAAEDLPDLRCRARLHRPPPGLLPAGVETVALVAIQVRDDSGPAVAARIAEDEPLGVMIAEDQGRAVGVLACQRASHALLEGPSEEAALALFRVRLAVANGYHLVVVADPDLTRTEGTVHALFECVLPPDPAAKRRPTAKRARRPTRRRRR